MITPITHLPQFLRAAALGNFSAVAREFGVSPVAVSKNMARLEAALGVRLFNRSTRAVSLTPEGSSLFERCLEPMRAIDDAAREATADAGTAAGRVRITCVKPFGKGYVIPLLQGFSEIYPEVRVEFALDDTIVDMVAGGYDIGIRAGSQPGPEGIAREICALPFVLCAAPSYLARRGVPTRLDDLAQHSCLRFGWPADNSTAAAGFTIRTGSAAAPKPVAVSGTFAATDYMALESAALSGLGLVQAPLPMVLPHFRSRALIPVLPDALFSGPRLHLHYRSRKNQPLRVKLMIDYLLAELRRHPDLAADPVDLCTPFWATQPNSASMSD